MPRKAIKRNRLKDVMVASDKLLETLEVWLEAVRTDSLTPEERNMRRWIQPAFEETSTTRKKKEPVLEANLFEPVEKSEAHTAPTE